MEKGLLTINEASHLSGKSPQTIRRLLKQKKLKFRRKRTPQGFSYFIDRSSISDYFDIGSSDQPSHQSSEISSHTSDHSPTTEGNADATVSAEKSPSAPTETTYGIPHQRDNDELSGLNSIPMEDIIEIDANPDFDNSRRDQNSSVFSQPIGAPRGESTDSSAKSAPYDTASSGHRSNASRHATGYATNSNPSQETAQYSIDFNKTIFQLINQYDRILSQQEEDKRKLFKLLEDFQGRVISLETRIKQLETPKKKKWYHVF